LQPRDVACRNTYGKYLARLGRVKQAMVEFDYAKKLAPADPAAYVNAANIYVMEGETGKAEAQFRLALDRGENEPEALLGLAELYMMEFKPDKACPLLERCLKIRPGNARAAELLGRLRRGR
jgi:Tfp pilus assembly protein PilF